MTLVAFVQLLCLFLWSLSHYKVCPLWHLSHYRVLLHMTFVTLWRLSHYDLCPQLWRLSLRGFVAVSISFVFSLNKKSWHLRFFMTFVLYSKVKQTKTNLQKYFLNQLLYAHVMPRAKKVPTAKKTKGLCPSRCYYSMGLGIEKKSACKFSPGHYVTFLLNSGRYTTLMTRQTYKNSYACQG